MKNNGIRILLLEDDGDVGPGIKKYLEVTGFEVAHASTIKEATELIRNWGFIDCALIDKGAAREPGLIGHRGGLGVVADLRDAQPLCRIIVMSGEGHITDELLMSGANYFMWKPLYLKIVVDELRHGALSQDETERECLSLTEKGRGSWKEV